MHDDEALQYAWTGAVPHRPLDLQRGVEAQAPQAEAVNAEPVPAETRSASKALEAGRQRPEVEEEAVHNQSAEPPQAQGAGGEVEKPLVKAAPRRLQEIHQAAKKQSQEQQQPQKHRNQS